MSDSNWYDRNAAWVAFSLYSLFFCFFVGYIAYSKGYQRSDQDHQADYTAHYEAQISDQDCLAKPTTEEAVKCYKEATNTAREHTRAEQDLSAQREMADWAELMLWSSFILGFVGIGVTGLGLFFVKRSLDAAVEANKLARFSERPWVSLIREVECRFELYSIKVLGPETHKATINWKFNLKNFGKTPSHGNVVNHEIFASSSLAKAEERFHRFVDANVRKTPNGEHTIFPDEEDKHTDNFTGRMLTLDEADPTLRFLFVIVTYTGLEKSLVGYEARFLVISESPTVKKPNNAKLLERSELRRAG